MPINEPPINTKGIFFVSSGFNKFGLKKKNPETINVSKDEDNTAPNFNLLLK